MRKILFLLIITCLSSMLQAKDTWSIGQATIQGNPVIYKIMNGLPDKSIRDKMHWLTVVSWKYNGSNSNGMPSREINDSMMKLEDRLEKIDGGGQSYFHVYSATGNNLKEFVFYIANREEFMSNFNKSLNGHTAYPIEVNFFKDKEWSDLIKLQADFDNATNK